MKDEIFKFMRILVWALPAGVAYNSWGSQVALLAFACQMFSVGSLTKIYALFKARQGPVEAADVQKFYLMINIVAGGAYAFFIHSLVGGAPPGPLSFGG